MRLKARKYFKDLDVILLSFRTRIKTQSLDVIRYRFQNQNSDTNIILSLRSQQKVSKAQCPPSYGQGTAKVVEGKQLPLFSQLLADIFCSSLFSLMPFYAHILFTSIPKILLGIFLRISILSQSLRLAANLIIL